MCQQERRYRVPSTRGLDGHEIETPTDIIGRGVTYHDLKTRPVCRLCQSHILGLVVLEHEPLHLGMQQSPAAIGAPTADRVDVAPHECTGFGAPVVIAHAPLEQ
jgi:hypothetical protein